MGTEFQKAPEPQPEQTAEAEQPPAAEAETAPTPQAAPEAQAPAEAGMPKAPAPPAAAEREHQVKRGDTLSKVAKEFKSDEVSLEQMLVLLYRSNPEAFAGKNMNRLKTGKVLQVPDASEAAGIDAKEARREVRLQSADFNAYKEKLAAAAGMGEAPGTQSGQSAGGAVSPLMQDKAPGAEAQPKEVLKLSKGDAPGGAGAAQARIRSLEEELAAREKTIKEQTDRVAKLEKQVKDMQVLLELKNKGMADLQKQAAAPTTPSVPAPAAAAPKPGTTPAPATIPGKEPKPAATPAPEPAHSTPPVATAPAAEPPAATAAAPAATTGAAAQSGTAATATGKKPRPKTVKAAAPEPGLLDQLMNPMYLGAGAAVLALLGFLGFRRMKKDKASNFDDIEVAEKKNPDVAPLTATDGTGAIAAAARSVAAAAPVTEDVDPLAEAEIYLAYGRDGQAEEILKEALQTSSRRQEIQLKLLEIYAKRKDVGAFDLIARDLQVSTGGQGELWLQAARLGYQVDPQNPRYASGRTTGEEPVIAAAMAAAAPSVLDEKLDFNIGLDETDTGTKTDIDLTRLGGGGGTSTDIDLSNLGASGAAPEINLSTISGMPERTTEVDLDVGAGGDAPAKGSGLDFDFDLNALSGAATPAPESTQTLTKAMSQTVADVGEPGLGTIEFDLSRIALDTGGIGKQEPTLGAEGGVPELDLSGINLDLGAEPGTASGTASSASRDDHWYDVQTKFDLAKAYQEMGDKEGAREILREVMAEGDGEQQAAAQRVLETLA
jgi:pilus assembly protein FimV